MTIESVFDPAFAPYGKVLEGYDTAALLETLQKVTPVPEGVEYVPSQPELEALPIAGQLSVNAYGGMPIQLGWCNGHNTKLNCLEYHRDSELNCGAQDFILLLAREDEMADGMLDTAKVKAFRVPAGALVEVYATTLHYAPCSAASGAGFQVVVVLPRGTNGPKPDLTPLNGEDETLTACNKWLLAHPETLEQREYPDAPLTRGRFVGQLYAAAGSPAAAAEAGFQDLLGIEWFLPAVNWAAETGVTGGTAEGAFAAARHLTWQEAAVFLVRTAEALGLEPEAVRTAPLPDALAEGAWDQTALELAWEWGLLPEDAGSAAEIARVQGGAMADAFAALL